MNLSHTSRRSLLTVVLAVVAAGASAQTQTHAKPFEPQSGQPGKDVVWVPTPQALVDKMLDLAKVTPQDYVIDLGSGDGRTVITAAKRGATAHGIEYNPDMVALSQRNAAAQGVTAKATFAKADLFETDFSKATVDHDVPAAVDQHAAAPQDPRHEAGHPHRVERVRHGGLAARRDRDHPELHPVVQGDALDRPRQGRRARGGFRRETSRSRRTFRCCRERSGSTPIANGKLRGDQITFEAGSSRYTGRVNGDTIEGTMTSGGSTSNFKASRSGR